MYRGTVQCAMMKTLGATECTNSPFNNFKTCFSAYFPFILQVQYFRISRECFQVL